MAIGVIHMDSPALGGATTYTILLPDREKAGPGPYPVLLQLHGMHDDHTAWLDKSRIWNYVERLPLIVVMPSGGNMWWSNIRVENAQHQEIAALSAHYEDFLMRDLWDHVQSYFPARQNSPWAIGGLSMGGYGAIKLGLKHPDRFCSIYAHSSALFHGEDYTSRLRMVGPDTLADMDPYAWATQRRPNDMPRLSFDCGLDDMLIRGNREFHKYLDSLGLPHSYAEYSGGHTWDYWDLHVQKALVQHAEVLGISPLPTTPPPGTEE